MFDANFSVGSFFNFPDKIHRSDFGHPHGVDTVPGSAITEFVLGFGLVTFILNILGLLGQHMTIRIHTGIGKALPCKQCGRNAECHGNPRKISARKRPFHKRLFFFLFPVLFLHGVPPFSIGVTYQTSQTTQKYGLSNFQ